MNYKILVILFLFCSNIVGATDIKESSSDIIKGTLQSYPLPTAEQILTAGLAMQAAAQNIIEQKNKEGCPNQKNVKAASKAKKIDLTSSPHRIAAHALYEKLGFEKYETNVYKLKI